MVTIAVALIYGLHLLRKEIVGAVRGLQQMMRSQNELNESFERLWKRIDEIELRQGVRNDVELLSRMRRFMDAAEKDQRDPPSS